MKVGAVAGSNRIILAYPGIASRYDGGVKYCHALVKALRKSGYDVLVPGGDNDDTRSPSEFNERLARCVPHGGRVVLVYPAAGVNADYEGVIRLLRARRADVHLVWFTPVPPRPRLRDLWVAVGMALMSKRIICHDLDTVRMLRSLPGLRGKLSWQPVPPTLDFEESRRCRDIVREELGWADDVVVGHFGYWYPSKGTDLLVRAFAEARRRVPNMRLALIGGRAPEGYRPFERDVLRTSAKLGLENVVDVTGPVDDKSAVELLGALDLYVLPYRRILTGRSTLALAAYLEAALVVAGRDGGGGLKHGVNCWVVAPGETKALVEALVTLSADERLRGSLVKGLKALRTYFSWESTVAGLGL